VGCTPPVPHPYAIAQDFLALDGVPAGAIAPPTQAGAAMRCAPSAE
jgi:hypothetical protein